METLQSLSAPEGMAPQEEQKARLTSYHPEIALGIMIGIIVCFALALAISFLIIISQDATIHDLLLNHPK